MSREGRRPASGATRYTSPGCHEVCETESILKEQSLIYMGQSETNKVNGTN